MKYFAFPPIPINRWCEICEKKFALTNNMAKHIEAVHTGRFVCDFCEKIDFSSLFWLNCHIEKDHQGFHCYICKMSLHSVASVTRHILSIHFDIKSHKCSYCQAEFGGGQYLELRKHIMNNHNLQKENKKIREKVTYHCKECNKKYHRLESWNAHVENIHQAPECYLCKKKFSSATSVNVHMKTLHFDVKSHTCVFCNEIFEYPYSELRHHIMNTHNLLSDMLIPNNQVTSYECDYCSTNNVKTFLRLESLNYHIEKVHLGYKCYICDKELNSPTSLIRHINIIHSDHKSHRCKYCGKEFNKTYYDLRRHIITEHKISSTSTNNIIMEEEKSNSISKIPEETNIKEEPNDEMVIYADNESSLTEKSNQIENNPNPDHKPTSGSGKSLAENSNINNAPKRKRRRGTFQCSQCGKSYTFEFNMKRHIRSAHSLNNDNTSATEFTKNEQNKDKNSSTTTIQGDPLPTVEFQVEKPFKCTECDKNYTLDFNLKRHIKDAHKRLSDDIKSAGSVQGKKSFKCRKCEKSYNLNYKLRLHMKSAHINRSTSITKPNSKTDIHKGYKYKNECKSCCKSFSKETKLKKHMNKVHEDHKNYKCESCGKSFSVAGSMKNHIHTIHEGHKNYKCESCSKSFGRAGSLKKHIFTIHQGHRKQN